MVVNLIFLCFPNGLVWEGLPKPHFAIFTGSSCLSSSSMFSDRSLSITALSLPTHCSNVPKVTSLVVAAKFLIEPFLYLVYF